jgi:hypothetical protein
MTVEDSRHGAHALWGVRPVDHSKLYLSDDGRRPLPQGTAAAKPSFQVMTVSFLHVVYQKIIQNAKRKGDEQRATNDPPSTAYAS